MRTLIRFIMLRLLVTKPEQGEMRLTIPNVIVCDVLLFVYQRIQVLLTMPNAIASLVISKLEYFRTNR